MSRTSSSSASERWQAPARLVLRIVDRIFPTAAEVVPAFVTGLIGLLPLSAARIYISLQTSPEATPKDLWRVLFGEIEAWCLVAFIGALIVRHFPTRIRPLGRVGFQLFATVLLMLSVTELTFFAVTGGRVDIEVLAFAWRDLPQVAPVFLSEVKGWHVGILVAALLVGLSPALLRIRQPRPWIARGSLLLLLPVLLLEIDGRPRPRKDLRILQPGLLEQLWWDGLERVGDDTIPPAPEDLAPITLTRVTEKPPFNVVLVLLESVGAHSTSVYTPDLRTTPHLAELAEKGWWVRNAYSVVPHTSKSIATTMCGTWPQLLSEIREARPGGLPDRCLPALLEELGFRTAFFQTADERFEDRGALVHRMGFDLFRSRDTLRGPAFEKVNYFGVEDRAMLEPGLAWSKAGDQPFFATYLTLTSHHDYGTPSHWDKIPFPLVKARQAQYLNAVRYVDDFVNRLVKGYEEAGLLGNTLFVILGDHGEAFGEHGRSMHDLVIYEEGLRIPMVLYGPGVLEGTGVIEGSRQQIDVLPTILGLLGVKAEGGSLPGTSLLSEAPQDRTLYHSCWRSHRCLAERRGTEKTIDHFRDAPMQRFDLANDPKERKDTLGQLPKDAAERSRVEMRAWRARVNGRYEAVTERTLAALQRPDASPALATWAEKMDLLGCTILTPEVLPAEAIWVRCRFRTKETLKQAWRIDLRVDGAFEPSVNELSPLDGLLPTFKWTPGVSVEDDLRVWVPANASPGPATVSIGWERYGNGALHTETGQERYIVGTVNVLPPLYPYDATHDGGTVDEVPSEDPEAEGANR